MPIQTNTIQLMKKWIFLLMVSLMMPAAMQAQDDLYFVPTKPNVEKSAKKYGMPARTYYSGSNRSVDDYNRRGTPDDIIYFDATPGVYPDSLQRDSLARRPFMAGDTLAMQQDDFEYSRRISRFDDDNWRSEAYWDGYRDGRRDWAWYDPWYDPWYCSWYDPWYHGRWGFGYSSWYGRPWYYGGWYGWHDPFYYSWYHPVVYVGGGSYRPVRGDVAGTRNHGGGHARSGSFRGSRDNSGSSSRSTRNSNFRVRNDNNNYRNFNQNTNRSNNSQFSGSSSFGGSRGGSFGGGGGFGGGSRGAGGSRGGGRR